MCQNASFIIYLIFLSHRTIYIFIKQLTSGVAGQFLLTIQLCVVMLNVRMDTITLSNNEFLHHYYLCVWVGGGGRGRFPILLVDIPIKKNPASANMSGVCSTSASHPSNVASLET